MPSYWPRSTIVGTVICAGSTTGSFEHMSMYVPFGIESSSARIASANASTTRRSAQSGWSRSKIEWTNARSIGRRFVREELRQLLAPLLERRRAFAGPDERVEREPRDALGMALREQRGAQRARRDAVRHGSARTPRVRAM